jgi:hypothetical protein
MAMTGSPQTSDQLAALASLHQILETNSIPYWLFGGWAVDFHAGRVTRAHDDIDIAVWRPDVVRLGALLNRLGWAHTPGEDEDGFTSYMQGAIRLEVAYLARDESGRIFTPLRNGRGEWPDNAFGDDILQLLGVRARVIRLAALINDKSVVREDPSTTAKDHADLQSLARQR